MKGKVFYKKRSCPVRSTKADFVRALGKNQIYSELHLQAIYLLFCCQFKDWNLSRVNSADVFNEFAAFQFLFNFLQIINGLFLIKSLLMLNEKVNI